MTRYVKEFHAYYDGKEYDGIDNMINRWVITNPQALIVDVKYGHQFVQDQTEIIHALVIYDSDITPNVSWSEGDEQ